MSYRIDINLIDEWDYNKEFRDIDEVGNDMLEANLELGQHSTLLVFKTDSGRYFPLGGNNRLRKMKTMNYGEVDCTLCEFGKDEAGYYPIFNGHIYTESDGSKPRHFETVEQGMLEVAKSHNTNPAYDKKEEMKRMMEKFPAVEWWKYEAKNAPINMQDIKDQLEAKVTQKKKEKVTVQTNRQEIVIMFDSGDHYDDVLANIEELLEPYTDVYIRKARKN